MARITPNVPLAEQVASELRRRIAAGDHPVGTLLPPETELAASFGVSRNSVREAIRSLVHAGMLGARAGYGTFVVATSDLAPSLARRIEHDDVADITEVRLILEREAARLAAARATEPQLAEMAAALADRAAASDGTSYVDADLRFHAALLRASGNALLAELHRGIGGNELALAQLRLPAQEFDAVRRELVDIDAAHDDLLAAIRRGDADGAAADADRMVTLAHAQSGLALRDSVTPDLSAHDEEPA